MKKIFPLAALALAACGGSSAPGSDAQFAAAAPSYDHVSLQIDDADATPATADGSLGTSEQAVTAPDCHPHLFARTHDVVALVNRHLWKVLHHERELIADNAKLSAGDTKTWEDVKNGVDRKFTMTLQADGSYSFELDVAQAAATPAFVKVMTGTLATTTSGTVSETKGSISFDFSALQSVVTTEKASGQIAATIDIVKDTSRPAGQQTKKSVTFQLTNFLPDVGNPHGPQNATYTHLGEPGVGGYFSYSDSLILLCPSNPTNAAADLKTFARWYQNNGVHGRSDAQATSGQIPAGDKWEGTTCYTGVKGEGTNPTREASSYWMMKLEDSSGNTVSGSAHENISAGVTACDAAFGAVPSLTNNATDFDFTKLPTSPIFPGQW